MVPQTSKNPTDRAKQGAKRSLLVEAEGIPVGLAVDGANRHDMKLVQETLESIPIERLNSLGSTATFYKWG